MGMLDRIQPARRRTVVNTAAQLVGRTVASLGRLVVASLIVRGCGREIFGEYSLILGLITLAEWIVDFGTGDVFVREICREPGQRRHLLRVLTSCKIIQLPLAILLLTTALLAGKYEARVIYAALFGGISLVFTAAIAIYRVSFRVDLTMEREIAAELISIAVMIPVTWLAR